METESIMLPKQLMDSIRTIVKNTELYENEQDFISQAIVKQISKFS